jgi:diadenosine tetraphosphate (Ap4A) HIT family hydrolase
VVDQENLYGNLERSPEIRFDPFQTWVENDTTIGYQTTIVPNRGNRPREHKPIFVNNPEDEVDLLDNVLILIAKGKLPAFIVADNEKYIADPFSETFELKNNSHEQVSAICVVNKYSIFSRLSDENMGVMLVAFPTTEVRYPRQNKQATSHTLLSLKNAINGILESNHKKNLKLTCFINIGANSGSSLVQFHAQAYLYSQTEKMLGNVEYSFYKSYDYQKSQGYCIGCLYNNPNGKEDELKYLNPKLTIWEDENILLKVAYAPIRTGQLRIIPKKHVKHIGELSNEMLESMGMAISKADEIMHSFIESRDIRVGMNDRSIAFRQSIMRDFHMIIDIFPVYSGFGGAELIIPIGINSIFPEYLGEMFRSFLEKKQDEA